MQLVQYPHETHDAALVRKIIELERTAWPDDGDDEAFPSAPETYVASFVLLEGEKALCHVGVRKNKLYHRGMDYLAYGLSEVVTHPDYRNRGLASRTIQEAAMFIIAQQPDISIFTCAREKVPFYTRNGWQAVSGACFVGGTREKPFRSDSLGLVTMMRFISPKSKRHRADFEAVDIVFELGEKQLW